MSRAPLPETPAISQVLSDDAQSLVEDAQVYLLDVREPAEWAQSRIPGAHHMPMMQVPDRLDELPKDKTILVQCAAGQRSMQVARFLSANGFPDVLNLQDGIIGWAHKGHPIQAGPPQ